MGGATTARRAGKAAKCAGALAVDGAARFDLEAVRAPVPSDRGDRQR